MFRMQCETFQLRSWASPSRLTFLSPGVACLLLPNKSSPLAALNLPYPVINH